MRWYIKHSPYLSSVNKLVDDESFHYTYIINNFFKAWGHQMIHNFDSLKALANQVGFSGIIKTKVGQSEFPDLREVERHGEVIPEAFNEQETLVVELRK